jgi:type IV pilus assembly protein PilA
MVEAKWFYTRAGQQQEGPVSAESIRQMLLTGYVQPYDMAWCDGMPNWQPLHAIADFAGMAYARGGVGAGGALSYRTAGAVSDDEPSPLRRTAIIAMVTAIVGACLMPLCCGIAAGPVAIIMSINIQSEMKESGNYNGRGFAIAALVIGIVETSINGLALAGYMMLR